MVWHLSHPGGLEINSQLSASLTMRLSEYPVVYHRTWCWELVVVSLDLSPFSWIASNFQARALSHTILAVLECEDC